MRIIDKNSDFYDYFQNIYYDNSLIFDRRNSFLLTKEMVCKYLSYYHWWHSDRCLLLQVCNTFWLFSVDVLKKDAYDNILDYKLELLTTWKNYNKKRKLIQFCIIEINKNNDLISAINNNNYHIQYDMTHYIFYQSYKGNYKRHEKNIPILKACGIANIINPLDIYLSFEEFFSLEKSSSERRDPIGITDIDKVENHGFDKKKSFRKKKGK